MSGMEGCDCRVEEYAASLLPACGSSTTCTLRALHGWFLCHHSMLGYVCKHWMSKIPACVGGSLLGAVETGAKLILALKSAPSLFSLLQSCSGSYCVLYVLWATWEGPQAFWTTWCVAICSWPYESLSIGLQRWKKMSGHLNLDHYLADLCNLITRILSLIVCSWLLIAFQA